MLESRSSVRWTPESIPWTFDLFKNFNPIFIYVPMIFFFNLQARFTAACKFSLAPFGKLRNETARRRASSEYNKRAQLLRCSRAAVVKAKKKGKQAKHTSARAEIRPGTKGQVFHEARGYGRACAAADTSARAGKHLCLAKNARREESRRLFYILYIRE